MKQLSSRWVITVLVVPVLLVLSILIAGVGRSQQATSSPGKGLVQVAFTGIVTTQPNQSFTSVALNVIGVRFHESSDLTTPESDPGWQTVAVSPGATAGSVFPTLSFGGNFGPNGNAIGVGSARTEMQIDVARLQNNLAVFNIGRINAITYKQVELLLDDTNPGTVTPVCGNGTSSGEGCISYPTKLAGGSSPRFAFDPGLLTVSRTTTRIFPLAINVQVGPAPVTSSDQITLTTNICLVPGLIGSTTPSCPFDAGSTTAVAAIVKGQIDGANGQGIVNAQLPGTGTIVSSATVDNTTKRNFTMILPAGTYDFVAGSGNTHTIDAKSSVMVPPTNDFELKFTVKIKPTRGFSGTVVDACTGAAISGATVQLYKPPSQVGSIDCASPSPADTPEACITCDDFSSGRPPAGCVVIATSSTSPTGAYPFSPSGSLRSAFNNLSRLKTGNYGLMATASGYNGELLSVKNKSVFFKCEGSGFTDDACNFSLQHGTLQVVADAGPTTTGPLNVMINAEDQGTFEGEGVQMITIPAGQPSSLPAPILVPIAPTPPAAEITPAVAVAGPAAADETGETSAPATKTTATPTATSTPVVIGGAANYDLFASVQDVFNQAPQKVGGHTIAVLSGVAAPAKSCALASPVTLTPLTCVGHGSVSGAIGSDAHPVDQNTLLAISKADPHGAAVFISSSQLAQSRGSINQNFSICEPADSSPYTISHFEAQPTGTPVLEGSADVTLTGPISIPNTGKNPCFGICSTPESSSSPNCLLCQGSTPLPSPIP